MKKKKTVALLLLIAVSLFVLTGCGTSNENDADITELVIEKFEKLTQIPRPTLHEKQVSDYLLGWAQEQGFEAVQDDRNNLIIEVPATKGFENKPLAILQGHLDMVFAQQDGLELDPLTTKIQMKNDGDYLRSDGRTSLGADDGIGIAILRCVAEGYAEHGPLRLILTTDEETGCTGVANLDSKYVSDAEYLINLDYELEGEAIISSASAVSFAFSGSFSSTAAQGDMGVELLLCAVHAGLECGMFARLNPELNMISIGPTLTDPHSVKESLEIATIEKVWALLEGMLISL